jgi:PAS domain S-box-containing protein
MITDKQSLNSPSVPASQKWFALSDNLDSVDFWKQVLDTVDECISIHTATGELLYANKRLLDTYKKIESEVIGSTCAQLFHTSEYFCPHEQVVETNSGAGCEVTLDNGARIFSVTIIPIPDAKGKANGYIRQMRDITYARRTQEQLLRAEHFATLSQMVSGIAHDLGTPLNIISGYSEYLLMRTKPEAQGHKELSTILQQTRRIADFIRHMLDLARPAQGRTDAIDLKSFLAESVDLMGHHFRKADVKVSIELRTTPQMLYGNAPGLRRAVFNLLLNAIRQIGRGGKLELAIDESSDKPDFIMIFLSGEEQDGSGHDFSHSLAGILTRNEGDNSKEIGLALAREVLNEFGAEVDSFANGEKGVPLVVYLPKKSVGQVVARQ